MGRGFAGQVPVPRRCIAPIAQSDASGGGTVEIAQGLDRELRVGSAIEFLVEEGKVMNLILAVAGRAATALPPGGAFLTFHGKVDVVANAYASVFGFRASGSPDRVGNFRSRNFRVDDAQLTKAFEDQNERTLIEDIAILEAQQRRVDEQGVTPEWIDVANDLAGVLARRMIASPDTAR